MLATKKGNGMRKKAKRKYTRRNDAVNPTHYTKGVLEAYDHIIDIVRFYPNGVDAWLVGQILKYLIRAPHHSNQVEQLHKAQWYMNKLRERQD